MNHIKFNDDHTLSQHFIRVRDGFGYKIPEMPRSVLDSPLFEWSDFENEKLTSVPDNYDVLRRIAIEPNLLPFKRFRIFVNANSSDKVDGTTGFKAWINHESGVLRVNAMMQPAFNPPCMMIMATTPMVFGVYAGMVIGRDVVIEGIPKTAETTMNSIITSICWFIREALSPVNFMATVSPDRYGKSVSWTKARTHYVLIHKAHPANNADVKAGSSVSVNGEYVKRQAHSRRAHDRILRSPRFRHKIGQTVRVKATWCGPKEWKQFGSIYKIVTE